MIGIVRIALRRPYTFIVMAMLILLSGIGAALRTPIDIFPNINIPVVAVVFSYTGLPPDDMAGRVVTFYERALTTSVNDIEHIDSQSIPNYGIIKIFFQPTVNINAALAEVAAMSQTVLKQLPAGITPPTILSFDAASVPVVQIALSSNQLSETTLYDDATSFIRPQLASVAGAAIPLPYGGKVRQVQADLNQQALHTYGISANDVVNALTIQNLITPVGTQKIGKFEYTVNLNDSPNAIVAFNDLPIKTVNGTVIYMRDVAYVHDGNPPQNQCCQGRRQKCCTPVCGQGGRNLHLVDYFRHQAAAPERRQYPAIQPQIDGRWRSVGLCHQRRLQRRPRSSNRSGIDRDDGAAVPRQLALYLDHHRVDPALRLGFCRNAVSARRNDQCYDSRWACARGRYPGRRGDSDNRKHQLAPSNKAKRLSPQSLTAPSRSWFRRPFRCCASASPSCRCSD